jgi:hypothetical protein
MLEKQYVSSNNHTPISTSLFQKSSLRVGLGRRRRRIVILRALRDVGEGGLEGCEDGTAGRCGDGVDEKTVLAGRKCGEGVKRARLGRGRSWLGSTRTGSGRSRRAQGRGLCPQLRAIHQRRVEFGCSELPHTRSPAPGVGVGGKQS